MAFFILYCDSYGTQTQLNAACRQIQYIPSQTVKLLIISVFCIILTCPFG